MQHHPFIKILLVSLVVVGVLAGCASTPPPRSGFLVDYPDLKPDPGNPRLLWWEKPDFDWKRYHRLMIDPVVMYYDPKAKNQEIRPDDLKQLADEFRTSSLPSWGKIFL